MICLIPAKTVEVQKQRLRKPRFDQAGTRSLKTELSVWFGLMRKRVPPPPIRERPRYSHLHLCRLSGCFRLRPDGRESTENPYLGRLKMLELKKTPEKGRLDIFREVKVK